MQAFRQVFEHLIEDFKTYRPLLSTIKNEYEMMLAAQREEIRRLEPLRVCIKMTECLYVVFISLYTSAVSNKHSQRGMKLSKVGV